MLVVNNEFKKNISWLNFLRYGNYLKKKLLEDYY